MSTSTSANFCLQLVQINSMTSPRSTRHFRRNHFIARPRGDCPLDSVARILPSKSHFRFMQIVLQQPLIFLAREILAHIRND
jgi:hypothetical protein